MTTGGSGLELEVVSRTVTLAGELDVANVQEARDAFAALVDAGQEPVVVDASGLTFCDSTGIGAFIGLARALPAGAVVLRDANHRLRALLELVGVTTVFTFEPEAEPSEADEVGEAESV